MLNARDNQFLKEINMLKEFIDSEMLRQLKDYKDGKETTDIFGQFTVEDYKEKMDNINGIINKVNIIIEIIILIFFIIYLLIIHIILDY